MKLYILIAALFLFTDSIAQEILINESFANNENKWFVGSEGSNIFKLDSGLYHVEAKGAFKGINFKEPVKKAFYISSTARLTAAAKASSAGFFLSNETQKESALYFVLNPHGLYSVFMRREGKTVPLIRWTASDYIFKADTFNTIGLSADSTVMNIYINDFRVSSFPTPMYNFNTAGIAVFDTSVADFDELFLVTYPQQEDKFGIDPFNLEEAFNYLLESARDGFREIRGKSLSDTLFESRLWLPSAREVFQSGSRYTAVFNVFASEAAALHSFSILHQKVMKAFPGATVTEGYDDENLPYFIIRKNTVGKPGEAAIDLYLFTQENKGSKNYFTAIDIAAVK